MPSHVPISSSEVEDSSLHFPRRYAAKWDIGKNAQHEAGTAQGSTSVSVPPPSFLSVPHKSCTSLPNSPALIPDRNLGSTIHSPLPHNKLMVQAEQRRKSQARTANRRPQREELGVLQDIWHLVHSCLLWQERGSRGFGRTHFLTLRGRAAGGAAQLLLVWRGARCLQSLARLARAGVPSS